MYNVGFCVVNRGTGQNFKPNPNSALMLRGLFLPLVRSWKAIFVGLEKKNQVGSAPVRMIALWRGVSVGSATKPKTNLIFSFTFAINCLIRLANCTSFAFSSFSSSSFFAFAIFWKYLWRHLLLFARDWMFSLSVESFLWSRRRHSIGPLGLLLMSLLVVFYLPKFRLEFLGGFGSGFNNKVFDKTFVCRWVYFHLILGFDCGCIEQ